MARPQTDRRRQAVLSVVALVVIALVLGVTWLINRGNDSAGESQVSAATSVATSTGTSPATQSAHVDDHVLRTLALIDAGRWPEAANAPGTRGGITFRNQEGLLPKKKSDGSRITYREWDVNPKERGRSRDAERIVTGSDGTAWYTDDHYRSFVQIRGPSR